MTTYNLYDQFHNKFGATYVNKIMTIHDIQKRLNFLAFSYGIGWFNTAKVMQSSQKKCSIYINLVQTELKYYVEEKVVTEDEFNNKKSDTNKYKTVKVVCKFNGLDYTSSIIKILSTNYSVEEVEDYVTKINDQQITDAPVVTDAPVILEAVVADPVIPEAVVADPVIPDAVVADPVIPDAVVADPVVTDAPVVTDTPKSSRYESNKFMRYLSNVLLFSSLIKQSDAPPVPLFCKLSDAPILPGVNNLVQNSTGYCELSDAPILPGVPTGYDHHFSLVQKKNGSFVVVAANSATNSTANNATNSTADALLAAEKIAEIKRIENEAIEVAKQKSLDLMLAVNNTADVLAADVLAADVLAADVLAANNAKNSTADALLADNTADVLAANNAKNSTADALLADNTADVLAAKNSTANNATNSTAADIAADIAAYNAKNFSPYNPLIAIATHKLADNNTDDKLAVNNAADKLAVNNAADIAADIATYNAKNSSPYNPLIAIATHKLAVNNTKNSTADVLADNTADIAANKLAADPVIALKIALDEDAIAAHAAKVLTELRKSLEAAAAAAAAANIKTETAAAANITETAANITETAANIGDLVVEFPAINGTIIDVLNNIVVNNTNTNDNKLYVNSKDHKNIIAEGITISVNSTDHKNTIISVLNDTMKIDDAAPSLQIAYNILTNYNDLVMLSLQNNSKLNESEFKEDWKQLIPIYNAKLDKYIEGYKLLQASLLEKDIETCLVKQTKYIDWFKKQFPGEEEFDLGLIMLFLSRQVQDKSWLSWLWGYDGARMIFREGRRGAGNENDEQAGGKDRSTKRASRLSAARSSPSASKKDEAVKKDDYLLGKNILIEQKDYYGGLDEDITRPEYQEWRDNLRESWKEEGFHDDDNPEINRSLSNPFLPPTPTMGSSFAPEYQEWRDNVRESWKEEGFHDELKSFASHMDFLYHFISTFIFNQKYAIASVVGCSAAAYLATYYLGILDHDIAIKHTEAFATDNMKERLSLLMQMYKVNLKKQNFGYVYGAVKSMVIVMQGLGLDYKSKDEKSKDGGLRHANRSRQDGRIVSTKLNRSRQGRGVVRKERSKGRRPPADGGNLLMVNTPVTPYNTCKVWK